MSTTANTKQFFIADPRSFDGDPFEVAERAAAQALALVKLAEEATEGAQVMARNAAMERDLIARSTPDPDGYDAGPEGRQWVDIRGDLAAMATRLAILTRAAGFNPKRPLNQG
jgi:hypothetical protein